MPIHCLIKCLINFWAFARFVFQNKLMVYGQRSMVYGQRSMVYGLWPFALRPSSLPLLVPLTLWLFVFLTLCLFDSLSLSPFLSLSLCLFDSLSLCLLFEKFRQKTNNFEPFFSDSTLTFLTYRNTFRLPILPTRRVIFLCLPLIQIRGRQRKTRGRQIFTGCAPKNPDFKGKVTKKGGSRGSSHISIQI